MKSLQITNIKYYYYYETKSCGFPHFTYNYILQETKDDCNKLTDQNNQTLSVTLFEEKDEGKYVCKATNTFNNISLSVALLTISSIFNLVHTHLKLFLI